MLLLLLYEMVSDVFGYKVLSPLYVGGIWMCLLKYLVLQDLKQSNCSIYVSDIVRKALFCKWKGLGLVYVAFWAIAFINGLESN